MPCTLVSEMTIAVAPPAIDAPLLQKLLDHITAHEEEWDQKHWARQVPTGCGTTYCAAGFVAAWEGWKMVFSWSVASMCERGKEMRSISRVAQEALGFSPGQGEIFFDGGNDLDDLWRMAEKWTGGEVRRPVGSAEPGHRPLTP